MQAFGLLVSLTPAMPPCLQTLPFCFPSITRYQFHHLTSLTCASPCAPSIHTPAPSLFSCQIVKHLAAKDRVYSSKDTLSMASLLHHHLWGYLFSILEFISLPSLVGSHVLEAMLCCQVVKPCYEVILSYRFSCPLQRFFWFLPYECFHFDNIKIYIVTVILT